MNLKNKTLWDRLNFSKNFKLICIIYSIIQQRESKIVQDIKLVHSMTFILFPENIFFLKTTTTEHF